MVKELETWELTRDISVYIHPLEVRWWLMFSPSLSVVPSNVFGHVNWHKYIIIILILEGQGARGGVEIYSSSRRVPKGPTLEVLWEIKEHV